MGCNTSSDAKKEDSAKTKSDANHKEADTQPNAEAAATKIQAVFRGHRTRKSMSMKPSGVSSAQKEDAPPTRAELEAEFRADDKELCNAATKIQASFRGHQSRKQGEQDKDIKDKDKEEELDIDLTDPELNKAATKIQASFRGHKVRKDVDN